MKKKRAYLLRSLATMILGAGLAACTQGEDLADNRLPEGKYPLTLTATVDGMQTRTSGKDAWQGGEEIGVRMGTDGAAAKYVIGNGGAVEPADGAEPLYWQTSSPTTVTAWYPYEAQTDVNISDQSGGFEAFDFLTATAQDQSYDKAVSLNFKHQMAKVKCTLQKGEGITDEEIAGAKVQIYGRTEASFAEGVLTGSAEKDGWITTTTADREALLVPQTIAANEPFIKIIIGSGENDKEFIYTPTEEKSLLAEKQHTYSITVKRTGLEVTEVSASWNDDTATQGEAQEAVFRVAMPAANHELELSYSDNVTVNNDGSLSVTGNPLVISYIVEGDDMLKGFPIAAGLGTISRTATEGDGEVTYTFTYNLRSDVRLDYTSYAQVGDYYYSDGTWLPNNMTSSSTRIGIVFKAGAGKGDVASNYGDKLMDNTIHGYVVALQDASSNNGLWGYENNDTGNDEPYLENEDRETGKYNGYVNTCAIRELEAYKTTQATDYISETGYWAFRVASDYDATNVPTQCSGWYLPSIAQLRDIYYLNNRSGMFVTAEGTDFKTNDDNARYWSATEIDKHRAWAIQFNKFYMGKIHKNNWGGNRYPSYVRSVLTF